MMRSTIGRMMDTGEEEVEQRQWLMFEPRQQDALTELRMSQRKQRRPYRSESFPASEECVDRG